MPQSEVAIVRKFNESRTPQQLADLLRNPSREEVRALTSYLGEAKFFHMRALALGLGDNRGDAPTQADRNVVVLPGIMGSELDVSTAGGLYNLWLNIVRLARDGLDKLKLDPTGTMPTESGFQIAATGLLSKYYGEIVLSLGRNWNVRAFAYDWRLDLETEAAALHKFIRSEFAGRPVSIVAHSMGGLVARSLLRMTPKADNGGPLIKRLVMLGTPNYGSFEVPLIFAGIQDTVQKLVWLTHPFLSIFNRAEGRRRLLSLLSTLPGIYQMLPRRGAGATELARAAIYSAVNPNVVQAHLQRGAAFLDTLESSRIASKDAERLTYIAGYGVETIVGVDASLPLDRLSSYWASDEGDGKVPHQLGLLPGVPAYFVPAAHGDLPSNELVLRALDELLESGSTRILPSQLPSDRGKVAPRRPTRRELTEESAFASRVRAWAEQVQASRGERPDLIDPVETSLADELVEGWISGAASSPTRSFDGAGNAPGQPPQQQPGEPPFGEFTLELNVVAGNIADCHRAENKPPIDAIAIGIYENQRRAWAAIRDLDRSIESEASSESRRANLLSDLIERGLIRGELAVPTMIPDPRVGDGKNAKSRHIVLVGMGIAGQFGASEVRRTAREFAWYLGRVGKRHLATILIGAGRGNLAPSIAMRETLVGLARAINDSRRDHASAYRLNSVTFVEYFSERIRELHNAIKTFQKEIGERYGVRFVYKGPSEEELSRLDEEGAKRLCDEQRDRIRKRASGAAQAGGDEMQPTRIIAEQVQESFWFSALTETASIPQRQVEIDPRIVDQQNSLLVQASAADAQVKAGRILGRLLIPRDFRQLFATAAPVVLDVDANTARVHWELIVHEASESLAADDNLDPQFLAINRGFTRQLRTRFAPPPEPLPSARRVMRALVIADPAADASLPGAQREGIDVVQIFKAFNQFAVNGSRIDVTELIGPCTATRNRVLGELLVGQYDIVHYAGHCFYDNNAPLASGWLFSRGNAAQGGREVLAAREMRRVERMPRFVFSNACESGVMPFRPEDRSSGLGPAFAEAFFERGVNNFICTGWPVNDRAARLFARVFYGAMLGLEVDILGDAITVLGSRDPLPLHVAMMAARDAVRTSEFGLRTWGAYQHYGNPFTRFFISRPAPKPPTSRSAPAPNPPSPPPTSPPPTTPPPAPSSATSPAPETGPSAPQPPITTLATARPATAPATGGARASFEEVRGAIERQGADWRAQPGVIDVRPGYEYRDGWITQTPAAIVVVNDWERLNDRFDAGGVPVQVVLGDAFDQVQSDPELRAAFPQVRMREFLAPGERPTIEGEIRALTNYIPPPDAPLEQVDEEMSLACHVSPDCGWSVLSDFLENVTDTLAVAMYDFTAPHIRDRLRNAVRPRNRTLALVLDPQLALGDGGSDDNPKADDIDEDQILRDLRQAVGKRLDFAWAAVTKSGKVHDGIFPKAYHIKVAVRDGAAFWLSSGNWQSSNQPPFDAVPREHDADVDFADILSKYNREWHAVIENENLAKTFETFIRWDLEQAKPLQEEEARGIEAEAWPELLVPVETDEERAIVDVKRHRPLELRRRVKVQPVLTPDNYPEVVASLIRSARHSIRFQNQYINIGKTIPQGFETLLNALKEKCEDRRVKVRIILRRIGDVRKMLDALQAFGFDVADRDLFRLQPSTHTKGIIVDDQRALIGSHNWSGPGTTRNRDASLLFDDEEIAAYYAAIFDHDWEKLAKPRVNDRAMPRVTHSTRDLMTQPGMRRVPWGRYFEDVDDI